MCSILIFCIAVVFGYIEMTVSQIRNTFLCITATCFGYINVALIKLYRIIKRKLHT